MQKESCFQKGRKSTQSINKNGSETGLKTGLETGRTRACLKTRIAAGTINRRFAIGNRIEGDFQTRQTHHA